jgi:hypothetical protein
LWCYELTHFARSYAYGRGLYDGPARQTATFFVQAVDRFGNNKLRGGDKFVPTLFDSRGRAVPINIKDNDDGTYTVTYLPDVGKYTVA